MKKPNSWQFGRFTVMLNRWAVGLVIIGSFALLQGCASMQKPYHTLHYCNVGTVTLTSFKIQYGPVHLPFFANIPYRGGTDTKCLGGASTSGPMNIPETMQVEWSTVDGQEHRADLPVRSKLNGRYPTDTIDVRFNGDHVEIFEMVRPTPATDLEFRIFP